MPDSGGKALDPPVIGVLAPGGIGVPAATDPCGPFGVDDVVGGELRNRARRLQCGALEELRDAESRIWPGPVPEAVDFGLRCDHVERLGPGRMAVTHLADSDSSQSVVAVDERRRPGQLVSARWQARQPEWIEHVAGDRDRIILEDGERGVGRFPEADG